VPARTGAHALISSSRKCRLVQVDRQRNAPTGPLQPLGDFLCARGSHRRALRITGKSSKPTGKYLLTRQSPDAGTHFGASSCSVRIQFRKKFPILDIERLAFRQQALLQFPVVRLSEWRAAGGE
jgi:hypothetical protein